jgi:uncharacterized protein (TIGR02757 family)
MKKNIKSMRKLFDKLYCEMNSLEKIYPDPIFFVHKYENKFDIEVAALISALFAFGKVENIMKNLEMIFAKFGNSPYVYITKSSKNDFKKDFGKFSYRFVNNEGMIEFLYGLSKTLQAYHSLSELTIKDNLLETLNNIRQTVLINCENQNALLKTNLLADIYKGSPIKRWMLFSRWMIRKDNVDLGLWQNIIKPDKLIIPLDTHILRIGRFLGFHNFNTSSMKTAVTITNYLKKINKNDPVKYDFSICHLGIRNVCSAKESLRKCNICQVSEFCNNSQITIKKESK